jgi:hypothetical protein
MLRRYLQAFYIFLPDTAVLIRQSVPKTHHCSTGNRTISQFIFLISSPHNRSSEDIEAPNGRVHRAAVCPRFLRKPPFGGSGATFVRRRIVHIPYATENAIYVLNITIERNNTVSPANSTTDLLTVVTQDSLYTLRTANIMYIKIMR